jgi:hypothetical protein
MTEQWAVRRWQIDNNYATATIRGTLADLDSRGGNGVIGRIFNDGVEIGTLDINNGGAVDYSFQVANLVMDKYLDFVIDPKDKLDFYDSTKFTAIVEGSAAGGDYNSDGIVDGADYVVWRKAKAQGLTTLPFRGYNISGPVGYDDYMYWREEFGESYGSGAALGESAVPEPSTVLVSMAAATMVLFRRARFPM